MIWLVLIAVGFVIANLLAWAIVYGGAMNERARDGEAPKEKG